METQCGDVAAKLFSSFFGSDFGVQTWCNNVPGWHAGGAVYEYIMLWTPFSAFLSHVLIAYASYIIGHSLGSFFGTDKPQEDAFSTDQIQERRNLLQDQLNLVLDDLNNDKRKIHDLDAEYEFSKDEIPRLQTQVKQVEEEMAIVQDKLEKLRADRLELHRRFYGGINDIANMQKVLEPQALDNQAARELIRRISNIEESISSFHDAMRNQSYSFRPFEIQDSARFSETT